MPLALYMDNHIPRAISVGLKLRNIDVITAREDNAHRLSDPELLDRSTSLKRVLFSFDSDLLQEAVYRQQKGIEFFGVIYSHPMRITIGQCILDIEIIASAGVEDDILNQIIYLPL